MTLLLTVLLLLAGGSPHAKPKPKPRPIPILVPGAVAIDNRGGQDVAAPPL
jgi:hypothetical protein